MPAVTFHILGMSIMLVIILAVVPALILVIVLVLELVGGIDMYTIGSTWRVRVW